MISLAVLSQVEQKIEDYSMLKPFKEINRGNAKALLKEYALLVWDGLAFFGTAEHKLERL